MLIVIIQIIGILIPLFGVVTLMRKKSQSTLSLRLILANMGCLVMNCGYLMFIIAQDDSGARMAIKFEYAGTVLFYLCFLFFLFAYMHIKPAIFPLLLWGIVETATIAIFWFDDFRDRYFGDFAISTEPTFNIFTAQVSPHFLYYLQYGLLAVIMILFFFKTIIYIFGVKLKAEKVSMVRLAISQVIITGALIFQVIKKPQIDILPFACSAAMLFVVISLMTDNFFGITEQGRAWVFDKMGDAYIIVDRLYGFLDANQPAKRLFPMLKIIKNGQGVPQDIISFFHHKGEENEVRLIRGKHYEAMFTEIRQKNTVSGYALLLNDITTLYNYNERLKHEVELKTEHIREVQNSIITGLANVVDSRDENTGEHIVRTSQVIEIFKEKLIAQHEYLGLSEEFLARVARAAPMHDLGKIAVDDRILRKAGRFTDEEYAEIKRHPAEGAKVLRKVLEKVDDTEFVNIAINVAHYHHERWDGKGYPDGLAREDIPVEARIMALADVFDALVSKRCYKDAFSFDRAFSIIEDNLETQFDPVLGRLFLECRPKLEDFYIRNY
ncbi:MAG: HD domain-containing protein [Oscillospiraceae bacterium]|nr:HD domain-containing protein [Oscillospiraceae bacterium]